ncbi:MAG: glycosyl hydrolase family 28-related protein [Candidatus Latescibacterota bacterium]
MRTIVVLCGFLLLFCGLSRAAVSESNVLDFGAVADGRTDNTKAFQTAIDRAGKTGGTVLVPAGKYRFDGSLTLPDGVALKGTWEGPHLPDVEKGSALLVYGGRDNENGSPFITMGPNTTLKGLTIWYPEQKAGDVHPYPWTVRRAGFRCSLIDLAIANTYNGIDCGTIGGGGQHLRNIDIAALRRGVYIDRSYDIGRIENVHIHSVSWVYGPDRKPEDERELRKYMLDNLEGFIIGKCDWEYMTNCFTIFTRVGFRFIEMERPAGQKPGIADQGNIVITQSGADLCLLGVLVERVQDHAGIAFENCQFMSGVEIGEKNLGPVKFANCGFWGVSRSGSHILSRGKGAVIVSACHFSAWDDPNFRSFKWDPKVPFIDIQGGSLNLTGSAFKDFGNTPQAHIRLGEGVRTATVMGNLAEEGPLKVDNCSKGMVQLVGNAGM